MYQSIDNSLLSSHKKLSPIDQNGEIVLKIALKLGQKCVKFENRSRWLSAKFSLEAIFKISSINIDDSLQRTLF